MSTRRLKTFVQVRDSRFRPHLFGPDDDLPEWAVAAITMRSAWADESDGAAPVAPSAPPPADGPAAGDVIDDAPDEHVENTEPQVEQGTPPRRRGRPPKAR